MSAKRELAAIMFTDIVGYTTIMARSEPEAMDLVHKNREIQKPLVEKHGGTWLKEMGDGALIRFPTASEAVYCALDILDAIIKEPDIQLKIGIHVGEVVHEGGDVYGDGVNIASRIEPLAKPNQILVTDAVHKNVHTKKGIRSRFSRRERVKNVEDTIELYTITRGERMSLNLLRRKLTPGRIVIWSVIFILIFLIGYQVSEYRNEQLFGQQQQDTGTITTESSSIAVLPFKDLSSEQDQEWFSDGLTVELLNTLANIPGLRVTARTSSFAFKGKELPVRTIADSLGVNHVLDGSIRKSGSTIRITVQLINSEVDEQVWTKTYERTFEDIFSIQEDIAGNIASLLNLYLDPEKRDQMFSVGTRNAEAYEAYLKGNNLFDKAHEGVGLVALGELLTQANLLYNKSISLDPEFAAPRYRHQDLYSHMLIHFPENLWPDSISKQEASERALSDLREARNLSQRSNERLFYDLEHAAISNDWSRIPDLLDQMENDKEALTTMSHFGGGWSMGLLIALDRAGIGLKMHEITLANDPLAPRTEQEIFTYLMANQQVDSALTYLEWNENELNTATPFGRRGLQILAVHGQYQHVLDVLGEEESDDLIQTYARIQAGMTNSFEPSEFDLSNPRSLYFTTFIYSALGMQEKADSVANLFDSKMMGPFAITDMMVGCGGKIAFDLESTPNLKQRLLEAGINDLAGYRSSHWHTSKTE